MRLAKRLICVILSGAFMTGAFQIPAFAAEKKTIIFVAPDGNDDNPGTKESPLKTPEAARDKLREIRAAGEIGSEGAVVYFREGVYNMLKIFKLEEQDSGVCYRAYRDEEVEFAGGMYLDADDFISADDSVKEKLINENARDRLLQFDLKNIGIEEIGDPEWIGAYSRYPAARFLTTGVYGDTAAGPELFIDDKVMQVSRYPNDGYLNVSEVIEAGSKAADWWFTDPETGEQHGDKSKAIPFTVKLDTDRMKYWKDAKYALLYGRYWFDWADQTVGLGAVDEFEQTITSAQASMYSVKKDRPFYIYNLVEEIDTPGEYYIDKDTLMLYLYPPQDGLGKILLTANEVDIIQINKASDITIKNINFKGGCGRAMCISNSENCVIDGCEISYFMLWNVLISGGKNNGLKNCIIHDNNGGVDLYGGDRITLEESGNYVENCEFYANDRKTKTYCPSLKLRGCGQRASYNKFHKSEHDMIEYQGNNHIIEYNEFFDCVNSTDDMGAIYNHGNLTYQGNEIRYNYFHDVGTKEKTAGAGTQGIFLDGFSAATTIYGNVFENMYGAPIKFAGSDNKVLNNIFINNTSENVTESVEAMNAAAYGAAFDPSPYLRGLREVSYMSEIWLEQYPWMEGYIKPDGSVKIGEDFVIAHNLFVNSPDVRVATEFQSTAKIEDNYITSVDPGFYDYKKGNYLLREDAAVYGIMQDFKPIPFTRMGMYSERAVKRIAEGAAFTDDSSYAYLLGKRKPLSEDYSARTFKEDDTLYVPLRFVCEGLEAAVEYNEATGEISVTDSSGTFVISPDLENITDSYGSSVVPEKMLKKIDDRVYISVDDLAELMAMEVYKGDITVMSYTKDIFTDADTNIVSYLKGQLSED